MLDSQQFTANQYPCNECAHAIWHYYLKYLQEQGGTHCPDDIPIRLITLLNTLFPEAFDILTNASHPIYEAYRESGFTIQGTPVPPAKLKIYCADVPRYTTSFMAKIPCPKCQMTNYLIIISLRQWFVIGQMLTLLSYEFEGNPSIPLSQLMRIGSGSQLGIQAQSQISRLYAVLSYLIDSQGALPDPMHAELNLLSFNETSATHFQELWDVSGCWILAHELGHVSYKSFEPSARFLQDYDEAFVGKAAEEFGADFISYEILQHRAIAQNPLDSELTNLLYTAVSIALHSFELAEMIRTGHFHPVRRMSRSHPTPFSRNSLARKRNALLDQLGLTNGLIAWHDDFFTAWNAVVIELGR
jgi:hypothetical protein